jgi:simple sugar transport system permease protein
MFALAVAGASCWALVPTMLKAKLGINEIVTGLMMNYMAVNLVDYLIQGPWRGDSAMGFAYTNPFPPAAWLPLIPGTRICWVMTVAGVIGALIFHVILFHTPTGFRIRVLGQSTPAALYAGINVGRVLVVVALAAGGMAGIAGTGEIAGVHHKLLSPEQISNGYGFTAVIAAMLARGQPLWLIPSSILLGIILASGDVITVVLHLPMAIIGIFTGLILYFLICGEFFLRYRLRWARRVELLAPERVA